MNNKILIARIDNSIEEHTLTDAEFVAKLAGAVEQHDINDSLTMWTYSTSGFAGYNEVANKIYNDYRGVNDDFFYGDVVFTGKSTLNRVYPIDIDAENLIRSYQNKESN
jgi:antirestriction protein